jgi:hypothetical protein
MPWHDSCWLSDVVDELAGKIAGLLNLLRPAHASLEETGGRVVALTAPGIRT